MYHKFVNFIISKILPVWTRIYRSKHVYPILHPPFTVIRTTIRNYNRHNVFKLGIATIQKLDIVSLVSLNSRSRIRACISSGIPVMSALLSI